MKTAELFKHYCEIREDVFEVTGIRFVVGLDIDFEKDNEEFYFFFKSEDDKNLVIMYLCHHYGFYDVFFDFTCDSRCNFITTIVKDVANTEDEIAIISR